MDVADSQNSTLLSMAAVAALYASLGDLMHCSVCPVLARSTQAWLPGHARTHRDGTRHKGKRAYG